MAADDLSAPLGQRRNRRRSKIRIPVSYIIAGALALFSGTFIVWAVVGDDPFGGEPMVVVSANMQPATAAKPSDTKGPQQAGGEPGGPGRYDGPTVTQAPPGQA